MIDVVGKMADEREIKVEHKTPEIIHKDLIGSPIHLKRLLMNILSNAVKYNKDYGKIYLSSREISSEQDKIVTLEFKCQDTGIGMSEEFQKHLFEPFAQEQKGEHPSLAVPVWECRSQRVLWKKWVEQSPL